MRAKNYISEMFLDYSKAVNRFLQLVLQYEDVKMTKSETLGTHVLFIEYRYKKED